MATASAPPPEPVKPKAADMDASVLIERRKFPRELPKPEVLESDSDSAWQAFQACRNADGEDAASPPPA